MIDCIDFGWTETFEKTGYEFLRQILWNPNRPRTVPPRSRVCEESLRMGAHRASHWIGSVSALDDLTRMLDEGVASNAQIAAVDQRQPGAWSPYARLPSAVTSPMVQ